MKKIHFLGNTIIIIITDFGNVKHVYLKSVFFLKKPFFCPHIFFMLFYLHKKGKDRLIEVAVLSIIC